MPISYEPMKLLDKILHPLASYLYVITYKLESGDFRNFYVESKRKITKTELEQVSAQEMIEMIEDESYKYEDDMPIPDSMQLLKAYRR